MVIWPLDSWTFGRTSCGHLVVATCAATATGRSQAESMVLAGAALGPGRDAAGVHLDQRQARDDAVSAIRDTRCPMWTPGATLWLRDMATATHRLGRWNGGPQSGTWDRYPPEWIPEHGLTH